MRILYLARRPIPSVNANSVQIVKMCDAFAKLGHEVTLVCHPGDAPAATVFERYGVSASFRVLPLPSHHKGPLPKWRYLLELTRRNEATAADLFFGRDFWSLAALARLGKPLIYEAHIIPRRGTIRWRLLGWLFERPNFAHLVCVTSSLADLYQEQFPVLAGKPIIVAPNAGADVLAPPKRLKWPGRPGHLQVGFAGRPFPGKGIEALLAAARELPEVDFHIVGATRDDLEWIEGPIPRGVYFHGYQPHAELGSYYRHFDVAVAPYGASVMNASRVESAAITSPLKLIEYMAAGLPSIVSDLPGVRDILGDREDAVIVPPGDHEAFVAAVRRLQDPHLRKRLGTAAREQYLERHTAETRARRVLGRFAAGGSHDKGEQQGR